MVDRVGEKGVDSAQKWKEKWEFAKKFIPEKLHQPDTQMRWYTHSIEAEHDWFNKVKMAYEKRKRAKKIAQTDPSDWAERTVSGLAAKTITTEDMEDYLKGDPIRQLVREARDIIRQVPDSIRRGKIWMEFMEQLRGLTQEEIKEKHNELLNWLRSRVATEAAARPSVMEEIKVKYR